MTGRCRPLSTLYRQPVILVGGGHSDGERSQCPEHQRREWFNGETLVWAGVDHRKHGCQPQSRMLMVGGKLPETEPGEDFRSIGI